MEYFERFCVKGPEKLKCPIHSNPELEVVYVKEGEMEINYGKDSVVVKKGQAALIFPYWLHKFDQTGDTEAYVLMFPSYVYEGLFLQYKNKLPSAYKFNFTPEAIVYVESLIRKRNELSEYEIKSLYYTCISSFFKQNTFQGETNNTLLQKMMEVIYDNVLENITIKSVSAQCGVSEAFLISYLKNQVRMKFKDCVNGLLVNKAVELLRRTTLSITQVAIQSGFGSLRSFNRIFAETMGCTPTQYRKKL